MKLRTIIFLIAALSLAVSCSFFGKQYTFTENIAPLVFKNCSPCHRESGAAPFPLTSYLEVKKKLKTIVRVTGNRSMPPWPADPNYSHFIGEKYLSDAEIQMIADWQKQGAPEGPIDKLPKLELPQWRSNIGKPDMVLHLDSVLLMPNGKDRFFIFKIPGQLPHDTFLQAAEFVAGVPDLVHHFNGHLLLYPFDLKSNLMENPLKVEITDGEYDQDFLKLNLLNDDGSKPFRIHSAVNYLPGVLGTAYPAGIGTVRLSRKFAFIGNDMHYGPSDRKVMDKSVINLFFTDKAPQRPTSEIMLGTNGLSPIVPPLSIPPGKKTEHSTRFMVGENISILTINPHLHMLGTRFLAYAIKPNGDTIPLISIPKWDFRWQYFYTFTHMVPVPRGSEIVAIATFDNTRANPNNPFDPPQWVGERLEFGGASMRATDEMFQFIITYTAWKEGDEKISLNPNP